MRPDGIYLASTGPFLLFIRLPCVFDLRSRHVRIVSPVPNPPEFPWSLLGLVVYPRYMSKHPRYPSGRHWRDSKGRNTDIVVSYGRPLNKVLQVPPLCNWGFLIQEWGVLACTRPNRKLVTYLSLEWRIRAPMIPPNELMG